jgi:predicted small lipoprotein YifL
MRLVLAALAGLLLLSACGKKAPLRPPPDNRSAIAEVR